MKIIKKIYLLLGITVFFAYGLSAGLPSEFYPNHEINDDYEKILEIFVQIEASDKIGNSISKDKFKELNTLFSNIFPYFPQEYNFKVAYEQCLQLTKQLSHGYDINLFRDFKDNCREPFNGIINQINSNYTTIAKISANPKNGSAPLTVTFDARSSIDPSNQTIPSNNFFRYYRDNEGKDKIIGVGPVVNYTFDKEGNYVIHLTVKSSNKISEGILDGENSTNIVVSPRSAIISLYANGIKMKQNKTIKIGLQEAKRGIVFDGSSTIPVGGRKIMKTVFNVKGSNGFSYSKINESEPKIYNLQISEKGEYKISLKTIDNEGNQLTENFEMTISDPVAIINTSPEEGTTSSTFKFDASASYSIISKIRLYTREIFNQKGEKIDTVQGKSIEKKFIQPGSYTIKLTAEDDQGKYDITTEQIFVDSTEPIPQFEIRPIQKTKYPSEFVLDASSSSDFDEQNKFDELSYDWQFSKPNDVKIVAGDNTNKKIRVQFDSVGKHTITLTIRDSFGKIVTKEKTIEVKSTLRPELLTTPKASVWGKPITFVVKSNKAIISYQRNLGDGITRTLQTNQLSHIYKKVGNYKVKLNVTSSNGEKNEINTTIFIGEKGSPITAYEIINDDGVTVTQNTTCPEIIGNKNVEHPAYQIERYEEFQVDTSKSVNIKGGTNGLDFYFQPKNDEIVKTNNLSYKFNEKGCQYIDVTTEDTTVGKNVKTRIWFKVVNALPTLSNLIQHYPQYGNEMGIGFTENKKKNIFEPSFDPLIIKISAMDAYDPDGQISYYKRYYYYKDDPSRILETKITPADVPYVFFSLPRIPGEFMFGVTMYDNDDGKIRSEDIIGNGPIIFFPPDVKRPDIPIVTLKVDKGSVEVGDEVIFNVKSSIVSDRKDFAKERTIQYDFDGDGERDITTKKDRIKYSYTKANEEGYIPRAAVLYRGYKGVAKGGSIIVKRGLKPQLMFNKFDKYVIFRDISIGEIQKKEICLSIKDCKNDENYMLTDINTKAFDFEYPDYGTYVLSMNLEDKHANRAVKRNIIELTGNNHTGLIKILSLPKTTTGENKYEIFIGNNLNNSILFNIIYKNQNGDCYIDKNISVDSDGDGIKDQDRDFACNELNFVEYQPNYDSIVGRIYYQTNDIMTSKDFHVTFLDYELDLDINTKQLYDKINNLIIGIDTTNPENEYLKTLLISLKNSLLDKMDTSSTIVTINDYINSHNVSLSEKQSNELETIINQLSDQSIIAANGGNTYQQSKAEILGILPYNLSNEIGSLFKNFENIDNNQNEEGQKEKRKKVLQEIINKINQNTSNGGEIQENEIDPADMDFIILPNICRIMNFYEIPSQLCVSDELKLPDQEEIPEVEKSGMKTRIKILIRAIVIIGLAFGGIVALFAIRARKSRNQEDLEDEDIIE